MGERFERPHFQYFYQKYAERYPRQEDWLGFLAAMIQVQGIPTTSGNQATAGVQLPVVGSKMGEYTVVAVEAHEANGQRGYVYPYNGRRLFVPEKEWKKTNVGRYGEAMVLEGAKLMGFPSPRKSDEADEDDSSSEASEDDDNSDDSDDEGSE